MAEQRSAYITGETDIKDAGAVSFEVKRIEGAEAKPWRVELKPEMVSFTGLSSVERVTIPRSQSKRYMSLEPGQGMNPVLAVQDHRGEKYQFELSKEDLFKLQSWLPRVTREDMETQLKEWGKSLIGLGVLHFVLSGVLDPVWGIVLIGLGAANLLILERGMFALNGAALLLVGVLNITGDTSGFFVMLGVAQLYWGAREIIRFFRYAAVE